jgi:hypothetical protein
MKKMDKEGISPCKKRSILVKAYPGLDCVQARPYIMWRMELREEDLYPGRHFRDRMSCALGPIEEVSLVDL